MVSIIDSRKAMLSQRPYHQLHGSAERLQIQGDVQTTTGVGAQGERGNHTRQQRYYGAGQPQAGDFFAAPNPRHPLAEAAKQVNEEYGDSELKLKMVHNRKRIASCPTSKDSNQLSEAITNGSRRHTTHEQSDDLKTDCRPLDR